MQCRTLKNENIAVVVCGLPRRKRCYHCGTPSGYLCDFPVGKDKSGKLKTCDRALCENCRMRGISQNVDFCRQHYPAAKAAYKRRRMKLSIKNGAAANFTG